MYRQLIFSLIIPVLLLSCQSSPPVTSEIFKNTPKISISVDNEVGFTLDSIHIQEFIFSPIEANHLFVFSYSGETFDLNLENGEWGNMQSKWGKYSGGLRPAQLFHDPYKTNTIWIANFYKGLIVYNTNTEVYVEYPLIRPVTTIEFTPDYIWIGTWKGLYRYDRLTSTPHLVQKIAEIYIHFISPRPDGKININNEYVFDPSTEELLKTKTQPELIPVTIPYADLSIRNKDNQEIILSTPDSNEIIRYPFSFLHKAIFQKDAIWIPASMYGLIHVDRISYKIDTINLNWEFYTNQTSADETYVWISNENEIIAIPKNKSDILVWQLPLNSKEIFDLHDPIYVYSHEKSSIVIRSKEYVLSRTKPLKKITDEENKFTKILDSTGISSDINIRNQYRNYKYIKSRFGSTDNPRLIQSIKGIGNAIARNAPHSYYDFDHTLIPFLDSIEEPMIKGCLASALIITAAQKGLMETAVSIDTQYSNAITDSEQHYLQNSVRHVHAAYKLLKDLKYETLQEDERLWRTANIYYDLTHQIGPYTEASSANMDYAFTYLEKLLIEYPSSPWADNAAFLMIRHEEEGSHEGGDTDFNLQAVEQLKRLLQKYPDTELQPEIYLKFITLHAAYGTEYYDKAKYLYHSLNYIDQFFDKFPQHHLSEEITDLKESILNELSNYEWRLEAEPVLSSYKIGSPILIHCTLTNNSRISKSISVYKQKDKYANFKVSISPMYDADKQEPMVIHHIHPEKMESTQQDSLIEAGGKFSETIDITKWVNHESYGQQGYFEFISPGTYNIHTLFNLGSKHVPSNKIGIVITK